MGMRCEPEKQNEIKMTEQRSRRLKAAVEQWMNVIDEAQTSSFASDDKNSEFEKTLRMAINGSKRSH